MLWTLLMAVGVVGVYAVALHFPALYDSMGAGLYQGKWFMDTLSVLVCSDYASLGGDPMTPNQVALHFYSDWWYLLSDVGLTGADAPWLGLTMMSGWLLCAIQVINPRTWWMALIGFLIVVSPSLQLGVNRGNVDLLLFMFMMPIPWLLTTSRPGWRWLAPVALALCTGLKYYPLLAAPVMFFTGGTRRQVWSLALMAGAMLTLVLVDVLPDFFKVSWIMPSPLGIFCFGRGQLLHLMGMSKAAIMPCTMLVFTLFAIFWWLVKLDVAPGLSPQKIAAFVMGGTLLLGCFLLTENYGYRLVFGLFLLPFMADVLTETKARVTRVTGWVLLVSLVVVVWADGVFGLFMISGVRRGDYHLVELLMPYSNWIVALGSWVFIFVLSGFLIALCKARLPYLLGRDRGTTVQASDDVR